MISFISAAGGLALRYKRIILYSARKNGKMVVDLSLVSASLLLLFLGAEILVRGSASIATRFGLSSLMVGLTIVAFGTSSPEFAVSLNAAVSHQADISIGNVVGSNIFNIAFILGLTSLIHPVRINRQIIKIDAPIALGTAVLLSLFLLNGKLGLIEGIVLLACFIAYIRLSFYLGKRENPDKKDDLSVARITRHWGLDILLIIGGLVLLVLGSRLLVKHSVNLARFWGVSEAVIGLTIVSAGTSIPELATSVTAALRKQPDIAVGNVVGSNIFNILAILGTSSIVSPLSTPQISALDYGAMIFFSILLIPLIYTGRMLHRIEGLLLLVLYGVYLFFLL